MAGIYTVLNIARSSLLSQQKAIDITGHNIANVNKPGYTRQCVAMQTSPPVMTVSGMMGTGVSGLEVERVYDQFLGSQINDSNQNLNRWETQKNDLEKVEIIFNESSEYGLSEIMGEFWNAWHDLSNNPSGMTERVALIQKAETMTSTYNSMYADLTQIQESIDKSIEGNVDNINQLASQIADVNGKIIKLEMTGQNANDYRDGRDQLLKEMSSLININSFEDSDGSITVLAGGEKPLVQGVYSWNLTTSTNTITEVKDVHWVDGDGNTQDVTGYITGGKLKGWIEVRDVEVPGYIKKLDALAQGIMDNVNSLHSAGYGLDESTGNNLFTGDAPASGTLDSNIAVTAENGSAGNITITLISGGTAGSETVTTDSVTGNITVAIQSGVSTAGQIATALQADSAINTAVAGTPAAVWTIGVGTDNVILAGGSSSAGMAVNSNIINDSNLIAAASALAGVPGDNSNAIAIAELQNSNTMSSTANFDDYFSSIVEAIGNDVQNATANYSHQSAMNSYMESYRESISGVSLDEEMVNLVKFQHAYDAAAKLITVVDEMMNTVMGLVR